MAIGYSILIFLLLSDELQTAVSAANPPPYDVQYDRGSRLMQIRKKNEPRCEFTFLIDPGIHDGAMTIQNYGNLVGLIESHPHLGESPNPNDFGIVRLHGKSMGSDMLRLGINKARFEKILQGKTNTASSNFHKMTCQKDENVVATYTYDASIDNSDINPAKFIPTRISSLWKKYVSRSESRKIAEVVDDTGEIGKQGSDMSKEEIAFKFCKILIDRRNKLQKAIRDIMTLLKAATRNTSESSVDDDWGDDETH
jgi:hypothetical protein